MPLNAKPVPTLRGKPVHIETPRFIVRNMTARDADGPYRAWVANDELMKSLNMPGRRFSVEALVQQITSFDNIDRHLIGIFSKADKRQVGVIMYDNNAFHRLAKVSVFVGDKNWWGKQVMEEAAAVLLDECFDNRGVEKVAAQVRTDNMLVIAPLRRLKFRKEGRLREEIRLVDGSGRADQYIYGLLKAEWLASRQPPPAAS